MIRVFPRRTKWTPSDELAFYGDPPLFLPNEQPVHISVTFTWHIPAALRLKQAWGQYYSDVQIGGPAFDDRGENFIPGRYIKEEVTITSRGCPHHCPWCHVPRREGAIRELPIMDGWIIQDNNLLACSREHIESVFEMLSRQPVGASFKGGLDGRLLVQWHIDLLKTIKVRELWFACDSPGALTVLAKVADLTADFPRQKKRCYVMVGYNGETLAQAEARLEHVYTLGFDPFCQLYRPEKRILYTKPWRDLARKWSRPALYRPRDQMKSKSKQRSEGER